MVPLPGAEAPDVAQWLASLGLAEYAERFAQNRIDLAILRDLTDADLQALGVVLGDRRRMLRAIQDLAARPPAAAGADAERRQLTILFCDLVGSTALSSRLDPEDLRALIAAYHGCCAAVIERLGGYVAQYLGDGVLAYFGYPRADEHDAERAVRAALAIRAQVPGLKTAAGAPLEVRLGIATGLVVAGDLLGSGDALQRAVIGETPNLAARIQGAAGPGMVAIADSTRRLIGDLFELEDLGEKPFKGMLEPQRVWRVLRPAKVQNRFEALRWNRRSELVGRDAEMRALVAHWERARRGEGGAIVVAGEPGIGKSRLLAALARHIEGEPHEAVLFSCSPHHGNSPLYPVAAYIEHAGAPADDDGRLAALLSLPGARMDLLPPVPPPELRERTLGALVAWLQARAEDAPLLVAFEDTHWADPTSLELLRRVAKTVRKHRILLLVTHRPDVAIAWPPGDGPTVLNLERLPAGAAEAIVERVLAGRELPAAARLAIVDRSDGIPLFLEEITKAALESRDHGVPESLLASLSARLDRLGSAKGLAQTAAAIGREFHRGLLAAVSGRHAESLEADLERLASAGLLERRGETCFFSHALVQDAAYGSLLREQRRALHLRIARALEALELTRPELLARHYGEAGEPLAAARNWAKAGRRSLERSALVEAADQLDRALRLLGEVTATPELRREELRLQVELSNALIHTRGHASAETQASFAKARAFIERAETLGEPLDDPLLPTAVLYGFWVASRMAFKPDLMRALAAQLHALAASQKSSAPRMIGHMVSGISLALLGELVEGRSHLDAALALYRPAEHRALGLRFGHDVRVTACCWRALASSLLGERDAAMRDADLALTEARALGHAASSMFALSHVGLLLLLESRGEHAAPLYEELIALAHSKGSAYWKAYGMLLKGWHLAQAGDAASGLALLSAGASAMRATGATAYAPWYLGCTASALKRLGRMEEARRCQAQALAAINATHERWCEPFVRGALMAP